MNEEWRTVNGYEGFYEVSNHGAVRSINRTEKGKGGFPRFRPGKLLTNRVSKWGYIRVELNKDSKPKMALVHRLVATAFIPNPMVKPEVNHRDGDKANNRPENLEWVTSHENKRHAIRTGLKATKKGCASHAAKLNPFQVNEARKLYNDGWLQREIAEKLGVARATIGLLVNNKTYQNEGRKN